MRMWMVNPRIMCRQHLLGEHLETHMFASVACEGKSLIGFIRSNCFEPSSLFERHDCIANEMVARGYNHKTPMKRFKFNKELQAYEEYKINRAQSLEDLLERCPECFNNYTKGVDHEK